MLRRNERAGARQLVGRLAILAAAVVAVFAVPLVASGGQGGLSPAQLSSQGWHCFDHPTLGVHCAAPGQEWPPSGPTSQLLYFFNTHDVESTVPDFTGTETLLHDDLYHGQPCPTQPGGYVSLAGLGLDYWACHRQMP